MNISEQYRLDKVYLGFQIREKIRYNINKNNSPYEQLRYMDYKYGPHNVSGIFNRFTNTYTIYVDNERQHITQKGAKRLFHDRKYLDIYMHGYTHSLYASMA
jgi:hypothetical protein